MSREFKLPELGEGVEDGDVLKVLVAVGDTIRVDQPVLELETDKATIEVPVPFEGVVKEIKIKEGEKVQVGQVILVLDGGARPEAVPVAPAPADGAVEDKAPEEPSAEVESTEKTSPSPPSPPRPVAGTVVTPVLSPSDVASRDVVPAAPSVRRIARELGVDIGQVSGSGPGSRILMEDVKEHAKRLIQGVQTGGGVAAAESLPDFGKWGAVERQAMSGVRRKIAEHLSHAWVAPHVTQHDLADITELEQARKRYGKKAEAAGGKLTMTAIALKIAASALKVFPQFNTSIDLERDEIVYKKYCHIGVAVDTERGLLVPVIRDVDKKNILEISAELAEAAAKARNRKLGLEDMRGGCFTITNLGGIGGTAFTPVINWPEVAILGIARGRFQPVLQEGQFQPRLMLPLSLSYDHRAIDGADGARFIRWVAEAFENPFLLSLEG